MAGGTITRILSFVTAGRGALTRAGRGALRRVGRTLRTLSGNPPALLHAHLSAAQAFREMGDHERAAQWLESACRLAPGRLDILLQHGVALRLSNRMAEAETALVRYLSARPGDGTAHLQLGQVLHLSGRPLEAKREFEASIACDPGLTEAVSVLAASDRAEAVEAEIRMADRLREERRYGEAADHYERAIALDPRRVDLLGILGNMLKDDGQPARAIDAYRRGIEALPSNADLNVQLGHAYRMSGGRADALAQYREACRKEPNLAAGLIELVWAGEEAEQAANFDVQLRNGTVESFLGLVADLETMRVRIDEMASRLPRASDLTGIPVRRYEVYRALWTIPRPPEAKAMPEGVNPGRWLVLVDATGMRQAVLYEQLRCLGRQTVQDFRVVFHGLDPDLKAIVERAATADSRMGWADAAFAVATETDIVAASDAEYLLLLDAESALQDEALAWFAAAFAETAAEAFVPDDEAGARKAGRLSHSGPRLRAAIDYESLLVCNIAGGTIAVRAAAFLAVTHDPSGQNRVSARSFLLLELAREGLVGHVPLPLVWRPMPERQDLRSSLPDHAGAVKRHAAAHGLRLDLRSTAEATLSLGRASWLPRDETSRIAVVIPTRDNGADVARMVESLAATAARPDALDILVLDNGSADAPTDGILATLERRGLARTVPAHEPFNWARLNNKAAALSQAPTLVFANDDMEMLSPGWDALLRGLLERSEIGVVGARLLYGDSTLQHGGVLLGWHGAGIHDGLYEAATEAGPLGRWHLPRNVAAVTGAFLATRRDVFTAIGGFDAHDLTVAWSDLDYCLAVRARGLRIHWTPALTLFHHESKTRGLDDAHPDRNMRPAAERAIMESRWGDALEIDPGLNPQWHMATLPFRLLRAPPRERIWDHIRRAGSTNPWHLEPAVEPRPGGDVPD